MNALSNKAKLATLLSVAIFSGVTAALWMSFGGTVYAAYISGMIMRCI